MTDAQKTEADGWATAKPVRTKRLIIADKVGLETQTHTFARSLRTADRREETSTRFLRKPGLIIGDGMDQLFIFMYSWRNRKQC